MKLTNGIYNLFALFHPEIAVTIKTSGTESARECALERPRNAVPYDGQVTFKCAIDTSYMNEDEK